ncbi:hypothetical protein [Serinibacter salmoneus]|uniref:Uncharacterized protein n=1 Tax=Serinibacter salmoneus TaxID=556530 RepID=A0A2A9D207_9MICO|nr:hypothetical protein [Serinibacter salmoneus]PFG19889.1 hypothetical protein ATL40_1465 [Serinibacter salmoneus]
MSEVLIRCPEHGVISVPSPVYGPGAAVAFQDSATQCWCGRSVPILDGQYTWPAQEGKPIRFVPTRAEAERLRKVLTWAQEHRGDPRIPEETIARRLEEAIEADAPALARAVDWVKADARKDPVKWVGLLLTILGVVLSMLPGDGIDQETLEQAIQDAAEAAVEEYAAREAPASDDAVQPDSGSSQRAQPPGLREME